MGPACKFATPVHMLCMVFYDTPDYTNEDTNYRIAGNFRGVKISLNSNSGCLTVGFREVKFSSRSACHEKNEYLPHENYPLYGIYE